MKRGAIVRIVIWSVTAFLLLGILVSGIVLNSTGKNIFGSGFVFNIGSDNYKDAEKYSVGNATLTDKINDAEIYWQSGKITVEAYDGDTVEISETGEEDSDSRLRYLVSDGKLIIHYGKSGMKINFMRSIKKTLTVKIPQSMASDFIGFKIDSTSADINVSGIEMEKKFVIDNVSGTVKLNDVKADLWDIDTISGEITAKDITATKFEADTVSGDIFVSGDVKNFNTDSTSGEVRLVTSTALETAECDSVSGDITLEIPEDSGFTAEYDTVSGDFKCDFAIMEHDDEKICGDGKAEFSFDTTSGDIFIKKN